MKRRYWLIAVGMTTALGMTGIAGDAPESASRDTDQRQEHSLAKTLDRIKNEYEDASRAYGALYRGSTIPEENQAKAAEIQPDFPAAVRRITEVAATAPQDPAVRDAMLWVIMTAARTDMGGRHVGEFAIASNWLARHFGDDPDAVRVGLELDNWPTANRDQLLLNFFVTAKGRESQGLARLALAQYFENKGRFAARAKTVDDRPTRIHDDIVAEDGSLYSVTEVMPDEEYAYIQHLKQCDPDFLLAEAERLYEEVIAEFGDLPYITTRDRQLETLLAQPEPRWNGEPLSDEGLRRIEDRLARRSTLGEIAESRLDDWFRLAVGKPAPEIEGLDVFGEPLTLSSYRGNVVALVFWGSWCGPCMQQIPFERELVEAMRGKPFVMLGVNTDTDPEIARTVMQAEGITWPNWYDGEPGEGPIAQRYRVRGYPTIYVIDAEGTIRSKEALGHSLKQIVEELLDK